MFAAQAATAALYARDAARRPARARSSTPRSTASVLRILEWTLAGYDRLGIVREREGNRLANSAPLDNYPTADGKYVCIVAGCDANFARLCKAMDRPDLVDDPRFATLADRAERSRRDQRHRRRVDRDAARRRGRGARASTHDVPVATAYTAADIFADPHMAARGDLVTVDDPVLGPVRQQAPFPRFVGEARRRADRRAPPRRAHPRGAVRAARPRPTPSSTSSPPTASSDRRDTASCVRRSGSSPGTTIELRRIAVRRQVNQRARQRSSMVSPSRKPKLR